MPVLESSTSRRASTVLVVIVITNPSSYLASTFVPGRLPVLPRRGAVDHVLVYSCISRLCFQGHRRAPLTITVHLVPVDDGVIKDIGCLYAKPYDNSQQIHDNGSGVNGVFLIQNTPHQHGLFAAACLCTSQNRYIHQLRNCEMFYTCSEFLPSDTYSETGRQIG